MGARTTSLRRFVGDHASDIALAVFVTVVVVALLFLGDDSMGCSVSVSSKPRYTTSTSIDSDWGPTDVVVEVGGDSYRCREMRWVEGDGWPSLDLRYCELPEDNRG